ncbi:MAG: uroporphyrinogen-III synthase, partial [Pseudomonadota bacterium]
MQVLVTRAEPAASRTALKLKNEGFEAVVLPLFEVQDTTNALPDHLPDHPFDAVVLTSANAARVLQARGWQNRNRDAVACCVGETTRAEAQQLGFEHYITTKGGGAALAEVVEHAFAGKTARFLYPTTADRTFDMGKALGKLGHIVVDIDIYKTARISPRAGELEAAIEACNGGIVLVYSQASGAHLAQLLKEKGLDSNLTNLVVIGISQTALNMVLDLPWRR